VLEDETDGEVLLTQMDGTEITYTLLLGDAEIGG
jgi:hypothetical protein